MMSINNVRELTQKSVVTRLAAIKSVLSITFVGSFVNSDSIDAISDIDVIVIVDKLTQSLFSKIEQQATAITGRDCGLPDYQVKLNTSFGPLKFNTPKTIVIHLMVYDVEGHAKHVIASPFTCYDWELNNAVYGKNLSEIYSANPLQLNDLIGTRRSLHSYLDDLKNDVISYRYYDFEDGIVAEKKGTYPMDERHKKEYGYHVMKYLMLNLLKILKQKNVKLSDVDLANEFKILDSSFKKHAEFFIELSAWKKSGAQEPSNIQVSLEDFVNTLEKWLIRVQNTLLKVVFIRHAKTALNDGTFLGVKRDPDIEAGLVGNIAHQKFDIVFTGNLKRTITTGNLFKSENFVMDGLLNEIDYGLAEGLSPSQLSGKFPEIIKAWEKGEDPVFPEGECQNDVAKRLNKFIESKIFSLKCGNVAVVSHNVVIRSLLGKLFNVPVCKWHRFFPEHLEQISCFVYNNILIPNLNSDQKVKFSNQLMDSL